jgi:hypothetical protein
MGEHFAPERGAASANVRPMEKPPPSSGGALPADWERSGRAVQWPRILDRRLNEAIERLGRNSLFLGVGAKIVQAREQAGDGTRALAAVEAVAKRRRGERNPTPPRWGAFRV